MDYQKEAADGNEVVTIKFSHLKGIATKFASEKEAQPQVLRISSKRPRTGPGPGHGADPVQHQFDNNHGRNAYLSSAVQNALNDLDSQDPYEVVRGLNYFTRKSFETTDAYSTIQLETYPLIILSFGSMLDTLNPLTSSLFPKTKSSKEFIDQQANPHREVSWALQLPSLTSRECKEVLRMIDENPLLLTMINIVRNFSYDLSNEQQLANSTTLLAHLVALAITAVDSPTISELASMALDTLVNIGTRIDASGKRRLQLSAWMEDTASSEYNKDLLHFRLSYSMSDQSAESYFAVCSALFAFVDASIHQTRNRALILRALELLQKLAQVPENAAMVGGSPQEFFEHLVELLCVNCTTLDPMASYEHDGILPKDRVPPYVGGPTYPDPDTFDAEIRDATLMCLQAMCQVSAVAQAKLADVPFALKLLVRIADIKNARNGIRTEGMQLACQVLALVGANPQNEARFKTIQSDLIILAFQDDNIADLVTFHCAAFFVRPIEVESNEPNLIDGYY